MGGWLKDIRYAGRSLARDAGFTGLAITIMTLTMGAATAVYSVVDGVLLEPLPLREPDRVVSVWLSSDRFGRRRMTPGTFADVARSDEVFASVAAFGGRTSSLMMGGEAVFLRGGAVTEDYFETLGVSPLLGRTFRAEELDAGGAPVVILGHHVWQQTFGADPGIVGRTVRLDGSDFQVIGVMPPGVYPTWATVSAEIPFTRSNQDFFVPLRYGPDGWENRRSHVLGMIGRLGPDTGLPVARAAAATLTSRLQAGGLLTVEGLLLTPFTDEVVGDVRFGLLALLVTVAMVLGIAVVNVGGLFVLRAADRRPELAIRTALGASRTRIAWQLFVESALVAGAASIGATLVARWALRTMRELVPYQIPRLAEVGVHGSSLLVALGLGFAVTVVFGLSPLWTFRGGRAVEPSSRRGHSAGRRERRLQGAVVATQAALGLAVLVAAALMTRSYLELRAVDTGFDARDTWAMTVPADPAAMEEIAREVRALPEVAGAAVAYDHPLERNWGDAFQLPDLVLGQDDPRPTGSLRAFGEGYFDAVGIEFVAGRAPGPVEMDGDVAYAVINESLRDTWFRDRDPIGARIVVPTAQRMLGTDGVFEILGVVEDVRFLGPDQPGSPAFYLPLSHFPVNATTLLVRPARSEADLLPQIRAVVRDVAPGTAVQRAQRLGDILSDLLARPRFNMMLLASFGAMGLILCGIGAYALVGRVVVMRFRELGIRMALGADGLGLAWSVLGSALRPLLLGGAIGAVAAFLGGRALRSLLYGISPTDPWSFALGAGFLLAVGVAAAALPTWRAVSIDPASTLRSE
jgi:predicted permease